MIDILEALKEMRFSSRNETKGNSLDNLASEFLAVANKEPQEARQEFRLAFENLKRKLDQVSIAVTGLGWIGDGVPSVEHEVFSLIKRARREVTLCAYSITLGAMPFLIDLRNLASQGVLTTVIVNAFSGQPREVCDFLKEASTNLPERFRVLDFDAPEGGRALHAKVVVVDRTAALVGSANLTFHGMVANHEMALIVRGPTAELVADRIDALMRKTVRI